MNFKTTKLILTGLLFIFALVSCDKNDITTDETLTNKDVLYAKTEYNIDMRDFAMVVNKAIKSNKSFRKLVREEALKKVDGDYDIILSKVMEKQVTHNDDESGINPQNKIKSNFTLRDLLEDTYLDLGKENKLQGIKAKQMMKSLGTRQNASAVQQTLIEELIEDYPNLQISVPFHAEYLEDENYIPPVVFLPEEYDEKNTKSLPAIKDGNFYEQDAQNIPDDAFLVLDINERVQVLHENVTPPTPLAFSGTINDFGISLSWTMPNETNETNTTGYKIYRKTLFLL